MNYNATIVFIIGIEYPQDSIYTFKMKKNISIPFTPFYNMIYSERTGKTQLQIVIDPAKDSIE